MKRKVMGVLRELLSKVKMRSRLARSWLYWMLQFPLSSLEVQMREVVQLPKLNEIFAKFETEAAMNNE